MILLLEGFDEQIDIEESEGQKLETNFFFLDHAKGLRVFVLRARKRFYTKVGLRRI